MSIKIMSEVWEHAPLVGTDLLVLLALADIANDDFRECWPSYKSVAHKARISTRQVANVVNDLEKQGVLSISQRYKEDGGKTSKLYRINDVNEWQVLVAYADDNKEDTHTNHSSTPTGNTVLVGGEPQFQSPHTPPTEDLHMNRNGKPNKNNKPPKKVKLTPEEIFRQEWAAYNAMGMALLKEFACDFIPVENQTVSSLTPYLEVAKELTTAGAMIECIPLLGKYIAKRAKDEEWTKYGVKTYSRYYTDFLKEHKPKIIYDDPAMDLSIPQPITPILIRERSES